MIIEKVDIKSFGLLTDLTLEFSEGVNIIEGQNEAGKSTIAAFIKYMLFGFDTAESDGVVSERNKRINWTTGVAQGSMVVRAKGKRYLISRSTVPTSLPTQRQAYKEDMSIIDLETGATAFGKVPAGEVLFGVERELFENTAFIGQIGDSAINEGSVKQSIENILFSASERINNQRAAAKIKEKMNVLLHNAEKGGVIVDLMAKEEELQAAMENAREDNSQILIKETELHNIRSERQEAEAALDKFYEQDSCYKNVMLIQTFDQLHELEELSAKKNEEYNAFIEANTRSGYAPSDEYLTDLAVARRGVNDSYRVLCEAESVYTKEKSAIGITNEIENYIELVDEIGGEQKILGEAKKHRISFMKGIVFGVLLSLAVLAAVVCEIVASGVLGTVVIRVLLGVAAVAAAAGVIASVIMLLKSRKKLEGLAMRFGVQDYASLVGKICVIGEARAKRDGMARSTENARVAFERAVYDYDLARTELTRVIVRWGEEPPETDMNEFLDGLEKKASVFLERKRILLEEKNTVELTVKEIRRTLSDKNEIDIRGQVSPLKRKSMAAINHEDIIMGIATNKAKMQEKDRLALSVENELSGLKSKVSDPGEYYVKLKAVEERIEELRNKHKAYYIAAKAIEGASENLRESISPRLGSYATELMGVMTDKKYSDFDISNGLKVSYTAEDGNKKSVDFLSGGTRDLAYIAVRLALIDMLYTEKPPICFDESFAHQDNIRARSMMKAIASLGEEGYQSFVFTCRGREAVLAEELAKNAGVFKLSVGEDL